MKRATQQTVDKGSVPRLYFWVINEVINVSGVLNEDFLPLKKNPEVYFFLFIFGSQLNIRLLVATTYTAV